MYFIEFLSENAFYVFLTLHCDYSIVSSTQWHVSFFLQEEGGIEFYGFFGLPYTV